MIMSVKFCLSYEFLNTILSLSKKVYFHENVHCCNGRRHDVICSRRKCYVMCGHNIIMTLRYPRNNSNVICERIAEIYPGIDREYLLF